MSLARSTSMSGKIVECHVKRIKGKKPIFTGTQQETLRHFRDLLKNNKTSMALDKFTEKISDVILRNEFLKISLMTRNNEFILKVMDMLKNNSEETEAGDMVDGPIYQRQTSACCEEKYLRKAVLYATSEDDPATLESLKEWAFDHGKVERTEKLNCYCPMIVACIERYSRCIPILYAMNYRVPIPEDYNDKISQIMSMKAISNNLHFYYILIFKGNSDVRMNKSKTEDIPISLIGSKKRRREIFYLGADHVTKFVRLKAYANPQYLVTEFKAKLASQADNLWDFDPLRKALAIATFTELLFIFNFKYLF